MGRPATTLTPAQLTRAIRAFRPLARGWGRGLDSGDRVISAERIELPWKYRGRGRTAWRVESSDYYSLDCVVEVAVETIEVAGHVATHRRVTCITCDYSQAPTPVSAPALAPEAAPEPALLPFTAAEKAEVAALVDAHGSIEDAARALLLHLGGARGAGCGLINVEDAIEDALAA